MSIQPDLFKEARVPSFGLPRPSEAAPAMAITQSARQQWLDADARISAKHDADEATAIEAGDTRLARLIAHRRQAWKTSLAEALALTPVERAQGGEL